MKILNYKHDTDYKNGYETGLKKGRKRIAGKLYDRKPPNHLYKSYRHRTWESGYTDGLIDRAKKITVVIWINRETNDCEGKTYRGHLTDRQRSDLVSKIKQSLNFSYYDHRSDEPLKEIDVGY